MIYSRSALLPWLVCGLLLSLLTACSSPKARRAGVDRAFIAYWPPPNGSYELRLAVKDNIDMKGLVTTVGSRYLAKTNSPALRDAKCMEAARARSVRIVGKTNLSEFALGSSGLNEHFGTPKNNLCEDIRLIPGGSSSGSAVAVATGLADVAFGTDTAGSIRTPAACCGVFGLKTTFGLVSLKGVYPLSPDHLDTVGPMAKDINRLVQGMDLLQAGFAAKYAKALAAKPAARQIRIGRLRIAGTDPAIDQAVDAVLAAKGFRVIELDDAFAQRWMEAERHGKTVALVDGWRTNRNHRSKRGVAGTTKAILVLGELESGIRYKEALKAKADWQQTLRRVFNTVDFIAVPTLQRVPPTIPWFGRTALVESLAFEMQNTAAVNFAGNPALAIPIPMQDENVPVTSLQLVGPPLSEAELLNAGRLIESKRR